MSKKEKNERSYPKLELIIGEYSTTGEFDSGRYEFEIVGDPIDAKNPRYKGKYDDVRCICGKCHLRWLYTLENKITGKRLFPVGSQCIKRFQREDLNKQMREQQAFIELLNYYHLLKHPEDRTEEDKTKYPDTIKLSSGLITNSLMNYLYHKKLLVPGPQDLDYGSYDLDDPKELRRLSKDIDVASKKNCDDMKKILKIIKEDNSINYDDYLVDGRKNPNYYTTNGKIVRYVIGQKIIPYLEWYEADKRYRSPIFFNTRVGNKFARLANYNLHNLQLKYLMKNEVREAKSKYGENGTTKKDRKVS